MAAATLPTVLPKRIVESNRCGWSRSSLMIWPWAGCSCRKRRNCSLLSENKTVSVPEKNADRARSPPSASSSRIRLIVSMSAARVYETSAGGVNRTTEPLFRAKHPTSLRRGLYRRGFDDRRGRCFRYENLNLRHFAQTGDLIARDIVALALLQILPEVVLHLIEGDGLRGFAVRHQQNVVTILRGDYVADLVCLQRKRRRVEFRNHLATPEKPKIAAV